MQPQKRNAKDSQERGRGSSETTGKPAGVSPIGGTEANLEVLQDLKNAINVHGLDVQAQKLLLVLEQPPSVETVVANVKAAASKPVKQREKRHSKKLPGHGVLIEFCTDENSNLGKAAESYDDVAVARVTEVQNASNSTTLFS